MIDIVLLIGPHHSGKTKTIKSIFNLDTDKRLNERIQIISKKINDKIWCGVTSSPQELVRIFCDYPSVIAKINIIIDKAKFHVKNKYGAEDFVLIIPFSISKKNGKMNADCIFLPIKELEKSYRVIKIGLHRKYAFYTAYMDSDKFKDVHRFVSVKDYVKLANVIEGYILSEL